MSFVVSESNLLYYMTFRYHASLYNLKSRDACMPNRMAKTEKKNQQLTILDVGKNAKQLRFLYISGGNAKWHNALEDSFQFLMKISILCNNLPPRNLKIYNHTKPAQECLQ